MLFGPTCGDLLPLRVMDPSVRQATGRATSPCTYRLHPANCGEGHGRLFTELWGRPASSLKLGGGSDVSVALARARFSGRCASVFQATDRLNTPRSYPKVLPRPP